MPTDRQLSWPCVGQRDTSYNNMVPGSFSTRLLKREFHEKLREITILTKPLIECQKKFEELTSSSGTNHSQLLYTVVRAPSERTTLRLFVVKIYYNHPYGKIGPLLEYLFIFLVTAPMWLQAGGYWWHTFDTLTALIKPWQDNVL